MYVRATDSNGNTTAGGSEVSDTFTIDATTPTNLELDSPGNYSYTNNERPTFRWKASSDTTAGLSKYVLAVDNPSLGTGYPSGDFTIDNISPTSSSNQVVTAKYVVNYDNFGDGDDTNNYISVTTRSSLEWSSDSNSGENDGLLREGIVHWSVKALDTVGNETSASRVLFVDRTSPKVEIIQINNSTFFQDSYITSDGTPTIYGRITDPLSGGDNSLEQTSDGPRVASGPKSVEIRIERKVGLLYEPISVFTINMDKAWWTCNDHEITDNTKQWCDPPSPTASEGQGKYLPFEFTPQEELQEGIYRITIKGTDRAENTNATIFDLTIAGFTEIFETLTPEEQRALEEEIEEQTKDLTPEEREVFEDEMEITKPVEPGIISRLAGFLSRLGRRMVDISASLIAGTANLIGKGISIAYDLGQTITDFNHRIVEGVFIAFGNIFEYAGSSIAALIDVNANFIVKTASVAANGINSIAYWAGGSAENILAGTGNALELAASSIVKISSNASTNISRLGKGLGKLSANFGRHLVNASIAASDGVRQIVASATFAVGQSVQSASERTGLVIVKIGYIFVNEPTTISGVAVKSVSSTSAIVTWETNHPATGKVNYGYSDGVYEFEAQSGERIMNHEFILSDLKPNTEYHYEVMSQNKNYVYDANRKFTTSND
jgi:hypothetical protein